MRKPNAVRALMNVLFFAGITVLHVACFHTGRGILYAKMTHATAFSANVQWWLPGLVLLALGPALHVVSDKSR